MEILTIIAWASIALGAISSVIIYVDIQMGRYQPMGIMNIAWCVTALFIWPMVLWMYFKHGRAPANGSMHHQPPSKPMSHCHDPSTSKTPHKPAWISMYISSTHCAAGCSIADIIGETAIYILGLTIAGNMLWMGFAVDYGLALLFGLVFQYFSIKPMQPELTFSQGMWQAFKADILSLTSFQAGMYLWMFISVYWIFHLSINAGNPVFWLMMQIAMTCGMITTMPVNHWLIKAGIKHACSH